MYTTLITAEQLQALLASPQPCRVFDCSFDLMQPQAGRQQYLQAHIPGAVFANLDTDLSAEPTKLLASHPLQPVHGGRVAGWSGPASCTSSWPCAGCGTTGISRSAVSGIAATATSASRRAASSAAKPPETSSWFSSTTKAAFLA